MDWYNSIIQYWAQIAVLIAAIGYVLKVFLDYRYKKKEIGYAVYAKARLEAFTTIFSLYKVVDDACNNSLSTVENAKATVPMIRNSLITFKGDLDSLENLIVQNRFLLSESEVRQLVKIEKTFRFIYHILEKRGNQNLNDDEFAKERVHELAINASKMHVNFLVSLRRKFT